MRRLIAFLAFAGALLGQNAALPPVIHAPFLDANGKPLAGGKLYFCVAGTSCPGNPQPTYTDSTGTVQNANPVVLDSTGYASIWFGSLPYKVTAQNSLGVPQWTHDGVSSTSMKAVTTTIGSISNFNVPGTLTAGNVTVSGQLTGAVSYTAPGGTARTESAKLNEIISVKDFGAVCDGVTDDTVKLQAAFNALATYQTYSLPMYNQYHSSGRITLDLAGGNCLISAPITLPTVGGGEYRVTNGTLSASASWGGASLISTNSGSNWYQNLEIDHVLLNGAHRVANALYIAKTAEGQVHHNHITGFTGAGVYLDPQAYNITVQDNLIEAYTFGEVTPGAGVAWTSRAGYGVYLNSPDNKVLDNTFRDVQVGVSVKSSTSLISRNHMYGCNWAVSIPQFTNNTTISDNYFDGCGVYIYDPYTVYMSGNWWVGPAGAAIYAQASGTKNFGLTVVTHSHIAAYVGPANVALTLSATAPGAVTVTAAGAYFDPVMVGSYVLSGAGVAYITGVTDTTHATAQITVAFSSTAVSTYTQPGAFVTTNGTFGSAVSNGLIAFANVQDATQGFTADNLNLNGSMQITSTWPTPAIAVKGLGSLAQYSNSSDSAAISFKNAAGSTTYGAIGYDTSGNVSFTAGASGANWFNRPLVFTGTAPSVSAGYIGIGGATTAATSCGSIAGSLGCVQVNIAGTMRYIPYF